MSHLVTVLKFPWYLAKTAWGVLVGHPAEVVEVAHMVVEVATVVEEVARTVEAVESEAQKIQGQTIEAAKNEGQKEDVAPSHVSKDESHPPQICRETAQRDTQQESWRRCEPRRNARRRNLDPSIARAPRSVADEYWNDMGRSSHSFFHLIDAEGNY